jgi:hypothetical protein
VIKISQKLRKDSKNTPKITHYKKSFLMEFPEDEHRAPIIHLQGSHYEMGYAFGKLYSDKILRYISEYGSPMAAMYGGWEPGKGEPSIKQMQMGLRVLYSLAEERSIPVLRETEPLFMEELKGKFDALQDCDAPLSWEDILLIENITEAIWNPHDPPNQCSNFAAWGSATEDGKLIHGVNVDFEAFGVLQNHISVIIRKPTTTEENIVMGLCHNGMIAPYTWMNDKGLSYGELDENTLDVEWPKLSHLWRGMKIAHHATTIDEAYEIVKKTGGSSGHSLLVSQANSKGKYAVDIELTGTEYAIRYENPQLPNIIWQTNIFKCIPGYPGYDGDVNMFEGQMKYIERILPTRPDHFINQSTTWEDVKTLSSYLEKVQCPRYNRYEAYFNEMKGKINLENAIEIQSDPALTTNKMKDQQQLTSKIPHLFGYNREIIMGYLWSVYSTIMIPEDRTLWIAVGEQPAQKGPYWYVNLDDHLKLMQKYENN